MQSETEDLSAPRSPTLPPIPSASPSKTNPHPNYNPQLNPPNYNPQLNPQRNPQLNPNPSSPSLSQSRSPFSSPTKFPPVAARNSSLQHSNARSPSSPHSMERPSPLSQRGSVPLKTDSAEMSRPNSISPMPTSSSPIPDASRMKSKSIPLPPVPAGKRTTSTVKQTIRQAFQPRSIDNSRSMFMSNKKGTADPRYDLGEHVRASGVDIGLFSPVARDLERIEDDIKKQKLNDLALDVARGHLHRVEETTKTLDEINSRVSRVISDYERDELKSLDIDVEAEDAARALALADKAKLIESSKGRVGMIVDNFERKLSDREDLLYTLSEWFTFMNALHDGFDEEYDSIEPDEEKLLRTQSQAGTRVDKPVEAILSTVESAKKRLQQLHSNIVDLCYHQLFAADPNGSGDTYKDLRLKILTATSDAKKYQDEVKATMKNLRESEAKVSMLNLTLEREKSKMKDVLQRDSQEIERLRKEVEAATKRLQDQDAAAKKDGDAQKNEPPKPKLTTAEIAGKFRDALVKDKMTTQEKISVQMISQSEKDLNKTIAQLRADKAQMEKDFQERTKTLEIQIVQLRSQLTLAERQARKQKVQVHRSYESDSREYIKSRESAHKEEIDTRLLEHQKELTNLRNHYEAEIESLREDLQRMADSKSAEEAHQLLRKSYEKIIEDQKSRCQTLETKLQKKEDIISQLQIEVEAQKKLLASKAAEETKTLKKKQSGDVQQAVSSKSSKNSSSNLVSTFVQTESSLLELSRQPTPASNDRTATKTPPDRATTGTPPKQRESTADASGTGKLRRRIRSRLFSKPLLEGSEEQRSTPPKQRESTADASGTGKLRRRIRSRLFSKPLLEGSEEQRRIVILEVELDAAKNALSEERAKAEALKLELMKASRAKDDAEERVRIAHQEFAAQGQQHIKSIVSNTETKLKNHETELNRKLVRLETDVDFKTKETIKLQEELCKIQESPAESDRSDQDRFALLKKTYDDSVKEISTTFSEKLQIITSKVSDHYSDMRSEVIKWITNESIRWVDSDDIIAILEDFQNGGSASYSSYDLIGKMTLVFQALAVNTLAILNKEMMSLSASHKKEKTAVGRLEEEVLLCHRNAAIQNEKISRMEEAIQSLKGMLEEKGEIVEVEDLDVDYAKDTDKFDSLVGQMQAQLQERLKTEAEVGKKGITRSDLAGSRPQSVADQFKPGNMASRIMRLQSVTSNAALPELRLSSPSIQSPFTEQSRTSTAENYGYANSSSKTISVITSEQTTQTDLTMMELLLMTPRRFPSVEKIPAMKEPLKKLDDAIKLRQKELESSQNGVSGELAMLSQQKNQSTSDPSQISLKKPSTPPVVTKSTEFRRNEEVERMRDELSHYLREAGKLMTQLRERDENIHDKEQIISHLQRTVDENAQLIEALERRLLDTKAEYEKGKDVEVQKALSEAKGSLQKLEQIKLERRIIDSDQVIHQLRDVILVFDPNFDFDKIESFFYRAKISKDIHVDVAIPTAAPDLSEQAQSSTVNQESEDLITRDRFLREEKVRATIKILEVRNRVKKVQDEIAVTTDASEVALLKKLETRHADQLQLLRNRRRKIIELRTLNLELIMIGSGLLTRPDSGQKRRISQSIEMLQKTRDYEYFSLASKDNRDSDNSKGNRKFTKFVYPNTSANIAMRGSAIMGQSVASSNGSVGRASPFDNGPSPSPVGDTGQSSQPLNGGRLFASAAAANKSRRSDLSLSSLGDVSVAESIAATSTSKRSKSRLGAAAKSSDTIATD
eukprot:TRINITY_DN7543_c0_g1_i1.p1 TRINITY_DN7543_c0_g1~~TRINITY_DN7543_c0_g1_i1.p1  ORF type:complete len:1811 (-),score=355.24 TRINITY_DN7543_c0_g1_i1:417-5690(-)